MNGDPQTGLGFRQSPVWLVLEKQDEHVFEASLGENDGVCLVTRPTPGSMSPRNPPAAQAIRSTKSRKNIAAMA